MTDAHLSTRPAVRRQPSVVGRPHVLVHAGLEAVLPALLDLLTASGLLVVLVEASDLADASNSSDLAMLVLPASNENELSFLSEIRPQCCLVPIAAVVNDSLGWHTYKAIGAGASSVINLLLPLDKQLAATILQLSPGCAQGTVLASPQINSDTRDRLGVEQAALLNALCTGQSVADLAKTSYCSERSMYRRIRALYDTIGVSSRVELRVRVAQRSR